MNTPSGLLKKIRAAGFFEQPCVHSGEYGVELEHAWTYAGRQIHEPWACVPVRPRFNRNPSADVKDWSKYCALKQAREWRVDLAAKYPKFDWQFEWQRLCDKFGQEC